MRLVYSGTQQNLNCVVASLTGKTGTRQIILDVQQFRESSKSRTTIISTQVGRPPHDHLHTYA